ncbi:hypothetical protein LRX75_09805 [Rhizobium sp. DKSPLA3]|uniref:Uncharacterized protein n=2 Tax=Rhizobium quercicola TaxID=2901226 RepID=A0A9X1NQJ0_9HYPH|nr:hypothetical protein [Rhizobium quercicola]
MTGAELTALLANGKVILLGGPGKGYSGTLNITADGKGKGEVKLAGGDIISIEGVWKIKKNRFCRVWKGGRDAGKEVCETWVKTGPKAVDVIAAKKNIGSNSWE